MTHRPDPRAPHGLGRGSVVGVRRPRGFTVLEVLIVIGILLAIAGLTVPAMFRGMSERQFEAVLEQFQQAAAHCRTEAMDLGKPRVLLAVLDRDGWSFCGETIAAEAIGAGAVEDDRKGEKAPVREVYAAMPAGYKVQTQAALSVPQEDAAEPREASGETSGKLLTLGVFLPDGTLYSGEPSVLLGPKSGQTQLAARIRLNRWTGAAACEVFDPKPAEKDAKEPAKEQEEQPSGEKGGVS